MWRPLLLQAGSALLPLGRLETISQSFDLGFERLNILLLPEDDIAQFSHRALEVCDLGFDQFDGLILQAAAHAVPSSLIV
jgi:hypothetical protein